MSTIINGTSSAITFPDSSVQNTSAIVSGYVPYANLPAGSVLQVVNATTGTAVSTNTTTLIDTGLTATITPKFASSKILVMVDQSSVGKQNGDERVKIALLRGSTQIALLTELAAYNAVAQNNNIGSVTISYLDSPATTSATTYKTQFSTINGVGTAHVQWNPSLSTITLMEIAA
jgi:hypothetical protein